MPRHFLDLDRGGQVVVSADLFIQQSEFAKSQLDCEWAYLHQACEYIHGIKVRQGLGRWGLLSRWQWPRGVMAPVRCRWLGASCSISPREKEAVMKRALACPGNRSSSLTVSGEDLQLSPPSKTLRPARDEGCRRGVVAEAVGGALMREEQQLVRAGGQSGVWHGQEWAAGSALRRDRPHQSAASIRRVGGCGWWCRD